jgi:hypothetical protein
MELTACGFAVSENCVHVHTTLWHARQLSIDAGPGRFFGTGLDYTGGATRHAQSGASTFKPKQP